MNGNITEKIEKAVLNYVDHIKATYADWNGKYHSDDVADYRKKIIKDWNAKLGYKVGSKYIAIWTGTSIHSFIVNTTNDKKFAYGDILKPATWKAPARNFERGNVFTDGSWRGIAWFGGL